MDTPSRPPAPPVRTSTRHPAARHRAARRHALAAALVVLPVAAVAAPAAAEPAGAGPHAGWERYYAQSFTAPGGTLCPFTLHSQVEFDREYVRTTRRFADGSPRTQEYAGPLVVRLVDRDTGRAVVRDLSARAVVELRRDGGYDLRLQGPAAVGFHPGDSEPPGYYVLRGEHVVRFAADGTRRVVVDRGGREDLCATLSDRPAAPSP